MFEERQKSREEKIQGAEPTAGGVIGSVQNPLLTEPDGDGRGNGWSKITEEIIYTLLCSTCGIWTGSGSGNSSVNIINPLRKFYTVLNIHAYI